MSPWWGGRTERGRFLNNSWPVSLISEPQFTEEIVSKIKVGSHRRQHPVLTSGFHTCAHASLTNTRTYTHIASLIWPHVYIYTERKKWKYR